MNRILPIVLMILGTMVPTVKVMAWASLYFGDYASTHNQIVSWAYDHMGGDNSFSLNQFPHESDVLPWDYVLKEGDHVKGTSPDADNNSKYSMHYYNPEIQEGGGPNAVAKYYGNMLDAIAEKKESVFLNKPAAWCAHFMADMNVPYHVVGTTAEVAYARMKNPVLNEDVTGPHDLYWHPSSIKQLTRPFIPPGWGLSNNFVHALRRFTDTYPPQSDGDWFDPWYLNGGVLEHGFQSDNDMIILGTGSHAIWEAVVMGTYRKVHMQKELDKLVSEDGFYDPLWKDPKPVFGEKVFENAKRQSEEFARAVAKRTRDNILEYWENPALALAHSVRSVSTLYRGSMTAMTLVHTVSEFEPGHYKIAIHVENNGSNYLKGVKGKLFLNGKNMGIVSLGEDLAIGLEDMLVWDYETNRMDLVEAVVEVIGDYDDTPDLGYKKLSFTFKTFEDELAEFSNATFPSNSLFEGNGENINPPSDPVITGPPVNEPDDDNVSLDSLIPMGFTILRKDGDEIVSVPPSDRFYAQVRTFAIDYDPGQEMHHMWTISDPQGTVIFKNSGQVEKDGEGPTTFLLSSKFRSKSRVGNYRFELSIFKGSSPIFQKQGVLKLVPLFEEAKLVIADKPEDPIEYEVFRPGDSIVFIETLKYNSVDPERTVHMDVVLSGTDLAIRALGSNGEYKLSNVNNTFTATASIPGIIQEGLYTVDVNIWSGEESVRITETFSIQHPVEFIGNRTTPGENMNLYKNQFGAGDFFGSFMNYRLKHTRPGDMYSIS